MLLIFLFKSISTLVGSSIKGWRSTPAHSTEPLTPYDPIAYRPAIEVAAEAGTPAILQDLAVPQLDGANFAVPNPVSGEQALDTQRVRPAHL